MQEHNNSLFNRFARQPIASYRRLCERQKKLEHSYRVVFIAIFYLVKIGCQWRMLPRPA